MPSYTKSWYLVAPLTLDQMKVGVRSLTAPPAGLTSVGASVIRLEVAKLMRSDRGPHPAELPALTNQTKLWSMGSSVAGV